jgi:hypothetical protein
VTETIKITTARAILDWINRPVSLAEHQARMAANGGENDDTKQRILPGVVGRTRFRVMWELTPQLARLFVEKMDEALADPGLSEPMRDAIVHTKKQVEQQCAALLGGSDGVRSDEA